MTTHRVVLMAKRLRVLREEILSASRPVFAEIVGLPPTTVKNYELGYREISAVMIAALVTRMGPGAAVYLLTGDRSGLEPLMDSTGVILMSRLNPIPSGMGMWQGDLVPLDVLKKNPKWNDYITNNMWGAETKVQRRALVQSRHGQKARETPVARRNK